MGVGKRSGGGWSEEDGGCGVKFLRSETLFVFFFVLNLK